MKYTYEISKNGYLKCPKCGELKLFRIWEVVEEAREHVEQDGKWGLVRVDETEQKIEIECLSCKYMEELHHSEDIDQIKLKEWIK